MTISPTLPPRLPPAIDLMEPLELPASVLPIPAPKRICLIFDRATNTTPCGHSALVKKRSPFAMPLPEPKKNKTEEMTPLMMGFSELKVEEKV